MYDVATGKNNRYISVLANHINLIKAEYFVVKQIYNENSKKITEDETHRS